jgi:hypothetical protein
MPDLLLRGVTVWIVQGENDYTAVRIEFILYFLTEKTKNIYFFFPTCSLNNG